MPAGTVKVDRSTKWGNPFTIGCRASAFSVDVPYARPETIEEVLADHRYFVETWLLLDPKWLRPLRGKNLACWCKLDAPCHAAILLELANDG